MPRKNYHQIVVRVTPFEYKQFVKLKKDHGLSARDVLELTSCPCDKCRGTNVTAYDRETGDEIKVPRAILSKK